MADNLTLPATGGTVATDDVGGVHFQRVKLDLGGEGASVPVSGALPVSASATDAILAAIQALLTTLNGTVGNHDSPFVNGGAGQIMLAKRRDSDTTTVADGDLNTLNMDEEGRLKVASKPASYAPTTGTVTSASSAVFINTERFSNLMIHCTGTFAGVNVTFEGSLNSTNGTDGNWFTVQAIRSNANTIETTSGVLGAAPAYAWELSVNAMKYFRVRATAWTSGTQTWTMIPGTYATEPIPGAQISGTQPVSGSVTASGTVTANEGTPLAPTANILNSAATTNGTVVKASAGTIYGFTVNNNGAAAAYFKLHNSTTITVGTTAVSGWFKVPAGDSININFGSKGLRHATGICYSITGGVADNDTAAVLAGQVKVNLSYV